MHRFKCALFIALGFLLIATALYLSHDTQTFIAEAQRAEGRVVALNAGGSHPQISFTDQHGQQHSYPQGGLIFGYAVGDKVQVLYRAEAPKARAQLDAFGALWANSLLFAVLGLAFICAGSVGVRTEPQ